MDRNYNLRSRTQMKEPEVTPSATVGVDDNGDVTGSQHRAFRNEYILKELFSHLSVKDLKECRLVNQIWNQVATRVFASKAPVLEFADKYGLPSVETMEKFMNTTINSENPPYRKFTINGGVLFEASPEQQLVLPRFIDKVAPTVTHLGVHSGGIRLFSWKKPKKGIEYPRLKSLELYLVTIERAGRLVQLKSDEDFMISILQHSPNLDTIAIWEVGREYADRIIENIPWTKIRHLKLQGQLEDDNFQTIVKLGTAMKLQSFEMLAWQMARDDKQVQASSGTAFPVFLDHQSDSLETLKFQFQFCLPEPHREFRLPRFPKLKSLEVNIICFDYNDNDREANRLLAVSSFSQTFPALSSLTVAGIEMKDLCRFLRSEDSAPVETVQTFRLDSSDDWEDRNLEPNDIQQVIRHLSQMFPNIRKLGVPATVLITKAIEMEHAWQHLKHLTLLCEDTLHVDSAIIGHSVRFGRIYNLKPGTRAFEKEERKIESKCKIFKFFQNLQTLELEFEYDIRYPEVTGFSDLSCLLVLLKLENLKLLNLIGLGNHGTTYEVTEPMIEEMRVKFKVLYKESKPID